MSDLKIVDFAVILRNLMDIGKPRIRFTKDKVLSCLKPLLAAENPLFTTIQQVSETVGSLSKGDMIRFEIPSILLLDQARLYFKTDSEAVKDFQNGEKLKMEIFCALHTSGSLIFNFHTRFQSQEGFLIEEAIENVRLNLRTVMVSIPENFKKYLTLEKNQEYLRWVHQEQDSYVICSLKTYTSDVLYPLFRKVLESFALEEPRSRRCFSSTLTQIYRTNPPCESIENFVAPQQFGKEILGLGTLDRAFHERSPSLVEEALSQNLSSDEELGVFTFGLSDLLLFDDQFEEVTALTQKKKQLSDFYHAVLYNTTHYTSLLEWVYLEKTIIDRYNRLLSQAISDETTTPEKMLSLQKQSMNDLIGYKAGITPFPSREEFLEKARNAHRIPELQEKLEKKRDLATDYIIQEYTLRTNRSIQLVNLMVAGTAVFGFVEVLLSIRQLPLEQQGYWHGLTLILFFGTFLSLWFILKFFAKART
jgi:hypothetical protein